MRTGRISSRPIGIRYDASLLMLWVKLLTMEIRKLPMTMLSWYSVIMVPRIFRGEHSAVASHVRACLDMIKSLYIMRIRRLTYIYRHKDGGQAN